MAQSDWMPRGEGDLVDLTNRWKDYLTDPAKQAAFGWDEEDCTAVVNKIDAFQGARGAYKTVDSTENCVAKDGARGGMEGAMRVFAKASIRPNKKMTDADKLYMGIRPRDTTLTRRPAPHSQPAIAVENTRNHYEHRVKAVNSGTGGTGKPADAFAVRYAWLVAEAGAKKPVSAEDLPKSKTRCGTSCVIAHNEAAKGKAAYYAVCYENRRHEQGPWSPVEEAVIG